MKKFFILKKILHLWHLISSSWSLFSQKNWYSWFGLFSRGLKQRCSITLRLSSKIVVESTFQTAWLSFYFLLFANILSTPLLCGGININDMTFDCNQNPWVWSVSSIPWLTHKHRYKTSQCDRGLIYSFLQKSELGAFHHPELEKGGSFCSDKGAHSSLSKLGCSQ